MREFKIQLPIGITLSSELSENEVSKVENVKERDMKNGYVWYSLPIVELEGENLLFSICFFHGVIKSLNVSIHNTEVYGANWNDWTEEKEKARAKDTEKWLSGVGYNTGTFSWGKIWSGYDSKSGIGHSVVQYGL